MSYKITDGNMGGDSSSYKTTAYSDLSSYSSSEFANISESKDTFFRFSNLPTSNFIKIFPYEFRIVSKNGTIASYEFPLAPQNIQKSIPTTETLEATMKGVYGTSNGAPFRQISIAGTSGTVPNSNQNENYKNAGIDNSLNFVFKNTIKTFENAKNTFNTLTTLTKSVYSGNSIKIDSKLNYNTNSINPTQASGPKLLTGYQTIHDMSRFFDFYLAGKKIAENKSWKLVFLMHKDQEFYACALNNYSINKSAGTGEYSYGINLTAYKRYKTFEDATKEQKLKPKTVTVSNKVSAALNLLKKTRNYISSLHDPLSGVRSDFKESFMDPISDCIGLGSDVVRDVKSVTDYSARGHTFVYTYLSEPIKVFLEKNYNEKEHKEFISGIGKDEGKLKQSLQSKITNGQPDDYVKSGDSADPFDEILKNAFKYPEVFDTIKIDQLEISQDAQDQIDIMNERIANLTAADLIVKRKAMEDFARSVSEYFGGGSQSYNSAKGYGEVKKTYKKMTVDDIAILNELNNAIAAVDSMITILDEIETEQDDYYKFYKDYAVSSGINFNQNTQSKFFVPFPLGATLEQVSLKYLGAAERWIEIAALNGLKSPYIDEDGTIVPIVATSGVSTVTVGSSDGFYIGQKVEIFSDTQKATIRQVKSIDIQSSISTIITFESTPSQLTIYKPSENAKIRVYSADTVNSKMLIAIPSLLEPSIKTPVKISPEINDLTGIAKIAKVDFLLDLNGDIVLSSGGDIKLAYGMTNLVQAATMKIKTNTGYMLQSPTFGNPIQIGSPSSEIDAKEILRSLTSTFASDPRFTGIKAGEVSLKGNAIDVKILVGISDTDVSLPITTEVPRA